MSRKRTAERAGLPPCPHGIMVKRPGHGRGRATTGKFCSVYAGAPAGAGAGAGFGAGAGAGFSAGSSAGFGAGPGAGFSAGPGAGFGAGPGAGFGPMLGAGGGPGPIPDAGFDFGTGPSTGAGADPGVPATVPATVPVTVPQTDLRFEIKRTIVRYEESITELKGLIAEWEVAKKNKKETDTQLRNLKRQRQISGHSDPTSDATLSALEDEHRRREDLANELRARIWCLPPDVSPREYSLVDMLFGPAGEDDHQWRRSLWKILCEPKGTEGGDETRKLRTLRTTYRNLLQSQFPTRGAGAGAVTGAVTGAGPDAHPLEPPQWSEFLV